MADDWAVIGCDDRGVTIERLGPDPEAISDHVASWAQQEEDKWPEMGLLYMLIPPDQVEAARELERSTGGNALDEGWREITGLATSLRREQRRHDEATRRGEA